MAWYDIFSNVYDQSLERQYAPARDAALAVLAPRPGDVVLDVPTGTGQSLDRLVDAVGSEGAVIGVDASPGMLRRARKRIAGRGLDQRSAVSVLEASVHDVGATMIAETAPGRAVDRVHVFLGLTVFPEWESAFTRLWQVLRPGGRMVVVDVYAERPGMQGRMVQWMARADLTRPTWEPLQAVGVGFERTTVSTAWQFGGELFCATAGKPRSAA